jgi:protein-disulfide isomerase
MLQVFFLAGCRMTSRQFLYVLGFLFLLGAGFLVVLARRGPSVGTLATGPLAWGGDSVYSWSDGAPAAPIEVVEIADMQCPDCARYDRDDVPAIRTRFIATGQVRWRTVFVVLPQHVEALAAAHAVACAVDDSQPAAVRLQTALYAHQPSWAGQATVQTVLAAEAQAAGLDMTGWKACMASDRYAASLGRGLAVVKALGVGEVPTLVVRGRLYPGGLSADALAAALAEP